MEGESSFRLGISKHHFKECRLFGFELTGTSMCAIAVLVLTVFHPGYFFKEMQGHGHKIRATSTKDSNYGSQADIETPSEK